MLISNINYANIGPLFYFTLNVKSLYDRLQFLLRKLPTDEILKYLGHKNILWMVLSQHTQRCPCEIWWEKIAQNTKILTAL